MVLDLTGGRQDLRANERLIQETRIGLAALASPFLTTSRVLAGAFAAYLAAALNPVLGAITAAVLPPLGAVAGTAMVASPILDPGDATLAVVATVVFGTAFGAFVLLSGVRSVTGAVEDGLAFRALQAAGGVAGIGMLGSAVIPTTLVLLDAPE